MRDKKKIGVSAPIFLFLWQECRSRVLVLRLVLSYHESPSYLSTILFKNIVIAFNPFHRKL